MRCAPFDQVEGQSPHWQATGSDPRLEILFGATVPPGWMRIEWESGMADPVSRPALVFLRSLPDGSQVETEIFLHAAIFGRQHAIVYVPDHVRHILICPADRPGPFNFRLVKAQPISHSSAIIEGIAAQPLMALHALGAALIGRNEDFRLLLTEAIHAQPLATYEQWKANHSRIPDWTGMDRWPDLTLPSLHVVRSQASPEPEQPSAIAIGGLVHHHRVPDWEDLTLRRLLTELPNSDLVMFSPSGSFLEEWAVPAMLVAASRNPDVPVFYGDVEKVSTDGAVKAEFMAGFDPLWTYKALASSVAWCVRIGFLRDWLEGLPCGERIPALPLYRPLVRSDVASTPIPVMDRLLRDLEASWEVRGEESASFVPEAAIIIPTRDRLPLLRACIDSIVPTMPPATEIVVVDNESQEPQTLQYLEAFSGQPHRKVVRVAGEFNFSRLCNRGARESSRRMLVFLNNDTTILSPQWLSELWHHAMKPDQGAIGARLFYPSGRVQHAGVIIGMGGFAGHVDLHATAEERGCFGRLRSDHSLLAVTGACLAVDRVKFEAVGGFDEVNLPVDLNDIDLCLRLGEKGWRTVFAAGAELVHHESASRGRKVGSARYRKEKSYFAARWRKARRNDPFFHPALSLLLTRPSLG